MKNYLLIYCAALLVSLSVSAKSKIEVKYYGQNGESLNLGIIKKETRYKYRDVDTTCSRQVPHDSEVCGYETYYRQGPCHWEPGNEVCSTEGGGSECHFEPGRTQCRTNSSGREVCRDLPGHQICENKPGRQVCHTTPGEQVCSDESYTQWECHNETTYTTETYACVETIKESYIVKRQVNAGVELSFKSFDIARPKFLVNVELKESGKVSISAKNTSDVAALMFAKTKTEIDDAGDDEITVESKVAIRVVKKAAFLAPVTKGVKNVKLSSKELSFIIGKIRNKKMISISLKVVKKGFIGIGRHKVIDKTLKAEDFKISEVGGKSKLTLKANKFIAAPKVGKKYSVSIVVKMEVGKELITPIKGDLKASFKEKIKSK